jgi:transcription elongation factor GreB
MSREKNYITPYGFSLILKEQEYLLKFERPKIVKIVTWAASLGDRSENADYIYGKKRLREIDRRLRFLSKRIDCACVIGTEQNNSSKVQFGATFKVIDEEALEREYIIVGVDEINVRMGLISWRSPIGKAVLGKSIGEFCVVKLPEGEMGLEIVAIEYKDINRELYQGEKWVE